MIWPFGKLVAGRRAKRTARQVARFIRARFDAAVTNSDNARHWANADGLSADAAASANIRRILRNRSRYEVANNSYAKGIVLTLANDCVGTGPRLQLLTEDAETNRRVEAAFSQWCQATGLASKLRTMRMAKATDGEAFAMLTANPRLDAAVKLDVQLLEADRVSTPLLLKGSTNDVDGIAFDAYGNPVAYTILRQHPVARTQRPDLAVQTAKDDQPARTADRVDDRPGPLPSPHALARRRVDGVDATRLRWHEDLPSGDNRLDDGVNLVVLVNDEVVVPRVLERRAGTVGGIPAAGGVSLHLRPVRCRARLRREQHARQARRRRPQRVHLAGLSFL